jgi:hypothetical protein
VLQSISPDGKTALLWSASTDNFLPPAIAVSAGGDVYLEYAWTNGVYEIPRSGKAVAIGAGSPQWGTSSVGIAVDARNDVYYDAGGGTSIVKITP